MRVVVIEDSTMIGTLIARTLEPLGHDVTVLEEDFAGIVYEQNWTGIDVVICDRFLDGYDGIQILQWLSVNATQIGRVMLTGDSRTDLISSYADKLLIKPVSLEAIRSAVEDWA